MRPPQTLSVLYFPFPEATPDNARDCPQLQRPQQHDIAVGDLTKDMYGVYRNINMTP